MVTFTAFSAFLTKIFFKKKLYRLWSLPSAGMPLEARTALLFMAIYKCMMHRLFMTLAACPPARRTTVQVDVRIASRQGRGNFCKGYIVGGQGLLPERSDSLVVEAGGSGELFSRKYQ